MATLIIFAGLPGVGKTTLCRLLKEKIKCYFFDSDEYAKNPDFVSKEELVKSSDVVIVAVPHSAYKGLVIPRGIEVVDLWGVVKKEAKEQK